MLMEIQLQVSAKLESFVLQFPCKYKTRQRCIRVQTIPCRGYKLAMHGGKSNYYEVLSLGSEKVGFDEIKKAYRALALRYHPDACLLSTKEESTRRFLELREAYETLSDPVSRRIYDCKLGLVDSLGCIDLCSKERRASFPKEAWERQLNGLKKRSFDRMERKKNRFI
ncbi:hypothetical protein NMG60_11007278 [Bertholletia excelsa]